MTKVLFGLYDFRFQETDGKKQIFDGLRKRFVPLTPEEWVRQHILMFLIEKQFPPSLIAVEKQILVNGRKRRFDIVVYNRNTTPAIIVECKAPSEKIDQKTLMQILAYNLNLKARFFWLTNGETNFFYDLQNALLIRNLEELAPEL